MDKKAYDLIKRIQIAWAYSGDNRDREEIQKLWREFESLFYLERSLRQITMMRVLIKALSEGDVGFHVDEAFIERLSRTLESLSQ